MPFDRRSQHTPLFSTAALSRRTDLQFLQSNKTMCRCYRTLSLESGSRGIWSRLKRSWGKQPSNGDVAMLRECAPGLLNPKQSCTGTLHGKIPVQGFDREKMSVQCFCREEILPRLCPDKTSVSCLLKSCGNAGAPAGFLPGKKASVGKAVKYFCRNSISHRMKKLSGILHTSKDDFKFAT